VIVISLSIYVASGFIRFALDLPAWSIIDGVTCEVASKLFDWLRWLYEPPFEGFLATAERVAPACRCAALAVGIPVLLISGIRAIRRKSDAKRGAIVTTLGAGLALVAVVGPLLMHEYWSHMIAKLEVSGDKSLAGLHKTLDRPDIQADRLARAWRIYAAEIFYRDGERVEIVTETGAKALYEPTDTDRKLRDVRLKWKGAWHQHDARAIFWAMYSVTCGLVGGVTRLRPQPIGVI
jgi:hypothetical protein